MSILPPRQLHIFGQPPTFEQAEKSNTEEPRSKLFLRSVVPNLVTAVTPHATTIDEHGLAKSVSIDVSTPAPPSKDDTGRLRVPSHKLQPTLHTSATLTTLLISQAQDMYCNKKTHHSCIMPHLVSENALSQPKEAEYRVFRKYYFHFPPNFPPHTNFYPSSSGSTCINVI